MNILSSWFVRILITLFVVLNSTAFAQVQFFMNGCGGQSSLIGLNPNSNQFNAIGSQNSSDNVQMSCNVAQFTTNTWGAADKIELVRTSDLAALNGVTKTTFDLAPNRRGWSVTGIYLGQNFTNDYAVPSESIIGAKIVLSGSGDIIATWSNKLILNGYSEIDLYDYFGIGTQYDYFKFTLFMNHSSLDLEYDDSQGHNGILNSKKFKIYIEWQDKEYLFLEGSLGSAPITDIKFLSSGNSYTGNIRGLKNLKIENISYTPIIYSESIQSGNWHEASTWQGGNIPSANKTARINGWHQVQISTSDAECRNLLLSSTSQLNIIGRKINVGTPTGGMNLCHVGNILSLTNGAILALSGRLLGTSSYSQVNLSDNSKIEINSSGKLIASEYLFDLFKSNYEFQNGTIYIRKSGEAKNLLRTSRYLGMNSRIIIGDSTGTHHTGNVSKLISVPAIGNLEVNMFTQSGDFILELKPTPNDWNWNLTSDIHNKAENTTILAPKLCILGNFINNGKVKSLSEFGFGVSNLYLGVVRGYAIASKPQIIAGTGSLITPVIHIANSHSSGITLQSHFAPKNTDLINSPYCNLTQGKVFLGNYDFNVYSTTGNSLNYIVLNGLGKLVQYHDFINYNRTFHVGTASSYTPITIEGTGVGGGVRTTFSVGLKTTSLLPLQLPATGRVNIEYDIIRLNGNLSNQKLTLNWNQNNEVGFIDRSKMYIARHNGNSWISLNPPNLPIGNNPYSLTKLNLTEWGTFSILSNGIVPPCPQMLNLTSTYDDINSGIIIKQTKVSNGEIIASNKITGNARVNYQAGASISLNSGFIAEFGTFFKAETGGCN